MNDTQRNLLTGFAIRVGKLTESVRAVHNDIGLPRDLAEAITHLEKAASCIREQASK